MSRTASSVAFVSLLDTQTETGGVTVNRSPELIKAERFCRASLHHAEKRGDSTFSPREPPGKPEEVLVFVIYYGLTILRISIHARHFFHIKYSVFLNDEGRNTANYTPGNIDVLKEAGGGCLRLCAAKSRSICQCRHSPGVTDPLAPKGRR